MSCREIRPLDTGQPVAAFPYPTRLTPAVRLRNPDTAGNWFTPPYTRRSPRSQENTPVALVPAPCFSLREEVSFSKDIRRARISGRVPARYSHGPAVCARGEETRTRCARWLVEVTRGIVHVDLIARAVVSQSREAIS